jgi:hypothetical protein
VPETFLRTKFLQTIAVGEPANESCIGATTIGFGED